jgi:hypothetical protein
MFEFGDDGSLGPLGRVLAIAGVLTVVGFAALGAVVAVSIAVALGRPPHDYP